MAATWSFVMDKTSHKRREAQMRQYPSYHGNQVTPPPGESREPQVNGHEQDTPTGTPDICFVEGKPFLALIRQRQCGFYHIGDVC